MKRPVVPFRRRSSWPALARVAGALLLALLLWPPGPVAAGLVETVREVKPSVVGITTVLASRKLAAQLAGTGFVVAGGRHVVTNLHVADAGPNTVLNVLVRRERGMDRRPARLIAQDAAHDLALLEIEGAALPAVRLRGGTETAPEGSDIAITGFPLGLVLGLVPATHRGTIAAVTGNVSAVANARLLDASAIAGPRFPVYQLDLIAYPGNSGSPLYLADSGEVIGIVNSGFVAKTKQQLLSTPAAISFAIPAEHIVALLRSAGLNP